MLSGFLLKSDCFDSKKKKIAEEFVISVGGWCLLGFKGGHAFLLNTCSIPFYPVATFGK